MNENECLNYLYFVLFNFNLIFITLKKMIEKMKIINFLLFKKQDRFILSVIKH